MSRPDNQELRHLIRDIALQRESHDRRELYWALIHADVLTAVRLDAPEGHITPADLHPLDKAPLAGRAAFGVFTHLKPAEQWQADSATGTALRLERLPFAEALPLLLDAGAGSVFINPSGKYTGELYRHELETCLDAIKKLKARQARHQAVAEQADVASPSPQGWFARLRQRWGQGSD